MSSFGLFNVGRQGLQTYQSALAVTGQNIANVNTPGYSRQVVDLEARDSSFSTYGVSVTGVRRIADGFVTGQLRADTAAFHFYDTLSGNVERLDRTLSDPKHGISAAIDKYFSAMQMVVDDPASQTNRQLLFAESEALVRNFNAADQHYQDQLAQVDDQLVSYGKTVTELSNNIAELNRQVYGRGSEGASNELLDQRDELVRQLSEYIDINVVTDADQMLNITVGGGQPLVVGTGANPLKTVPGTPDPSMLGVAVQVGGRDIDVSEDVSGGKIGGLLAYQQQVLVPGRNQLGSLAISFADAMNSQHRQGVDQGGIRGGDLFNDINAGEAPSFTIGAATGTTATPRVEIADTGALINTDYSISLNAGMVSVLRSDGSDALSPASQAYVPGQPILFDGLSVDLDSAASASLTNGSFTLTSAFPGSSERVVPGSGNSDPSLTNNTWVEISDPSKLQASDYEVRFSSSSEFEVTRLSDGKVIDSFDYPADRVFTLADEGLTVSLDTPTSAGGVVAAFAAGDSLLLKPVRQGAEDLEFALASISQFAMASPVRGAAALDNNGSGVIEAMRVIDPEAPMFVAKSGQLTLPGQSQPGTIEIVFNAPDSSGQQTFHVLDATDPSNPQPLDLGAGPLRDQPFNPPQTINLGGFEVVLKGLPAAGDHFNFEFNRDGASDNRNAKALFDLQQASKGPEGKSFQDAYGSLIQEIAIRAGSARINKDASEAIVKSTEELRNSISGVNLDEEASKLMQYEQAYNASAQVMTVARSLFDTLLQTIS